MSFTDLQYPFFLLLIIIIFYRINHQYRWILLLAASYYFYSCWNPKYLLLIIFSTLIDYYAGIKIAEAKTNKGKKNYHVIKFIDYSKLLDTSPCLGYDCKNFCDFDHVDTDGSDMISRLLARDLLR